MKTKLMVSAFLLSMITSMAVAADPVVPKFVVLNQKESGIYKLIYEGVKTGKVNMKIYSESGLLVFDETLANVNGFVRVVNFKNMNEGDYRIELSDESGKLIQKVSYNPAKRVDAVHVAKLKEDGKYLISAAKSEEPINVAIFDQDNNLLYNKTLASADGVAIVYNLKSVKGSPTFQVSDSNGNVRTIRY